MKGATEKSAKHGTSNPVQRDEDGARDRRTQTTVTKVAFDTNMLLAIKRFKVDIFNDAKMMLGKVEFVEPEQVLKELEGLSRENKELAREARIAVELLEKNGFRTVKIGARDCDEALLKLSKDVIIGTNDKKLKDSVSQQGGTVLFLRQKKFLELN